MSKSFDMQKKRGGNKDMTSEEKDVLRKRVRELEKELKETKKELKDKRILMNGEKLKKSGRNSGSGSIAQFAKVTLGLQMTRKTTLLCKPW